MDTVTVVSDAPGIKHAAGEGVEKGAGKPILSPELYVLVDGRMRGKDASTNLPLRGVGPMAPLVRKHFKLVQGRMFKEGTNEVIVGDGVVKQYEGSRSRQEGPLGGRRLDGGRAASPTRAASPSPKPGATPAWCSRPGGAATAFSRFA